jgi:hypothetical protein
MQYTGPEFVLDARFQLRLLYTEDKTAVFREVGMELRNGKVSLSIHPDDNRRIILTLGKRDATAPQLEQLNEALVTQVFGPDKDDKDRYLNAENRILTAVELFFYEKFVGQIPFPDFNRYLQTFKINPPFAFVDWTWTNMGLGFLVIQAATDSPGSVSHHPQACSPVGDVTRELDADVDTSRIPVRSETLDDRRKKFDIPKGTLFPTRIYHREQVKDETQLPVPTDIDTRSIQFWTYFPSETTLNEHLDAFRAGDRYDMPAKNGNYVLVGWRADASAKYTDGSLHYLIGENRLEARLKLTGWAYAFGWIVLGCFTFAAGAAVLMKANPVIDLNLRYNSRTQDIYISPRIRKSKASMLLLETMFWPLSIISNMILNLFADHIFRKMFGKALNKLTQPLINLEDVFGNQAPRATMAHSFRTGSLLIGLEGEVQPLSE